MPGWAKALLITLSIVVVLVVGAVVIGVVYVARNKDAWLAKGKEVMTEGRDYCQNLFAPIQQFCEERARKEN